MDTWFHFRLKTLHAFKLPGKQFSSQPHRPKGSSVGSLVCPLDSEHDTVPTLVMEKKRTKGEKGQGASEGRSAGAPGKFWGGGRGRGVRITSKYSQCNPRG